MKNKCITLLGQEVGGCVVCLHERFCIKDGHIEEGMLIHKTRLVFLQNCSLRYGVIDETLDN